MEIHISLELRLLAHPLCCCSGSGKVKTLPGSNLWAMRNLGLRCWYGVWEEGAVLAF